MPRRTWAALYSFSSFLACSCPLPFHYDECCSVCQIGYGGKRAYDPELDEYTCINGKKLRAVHNGEKKSKSGHVKQVTYHDCESCQGCPFRKNCTRAKGNRKLQVTKRFIEQRGESRKCITGTEGVLLRMNSPIQSEGAFGIIKQNYGFRQYLLQDNKKVFAETLLIAMAYNVNKLHAKIQQNRTGRQLFENL